MTPSTTEMVVEGVIVIVGELLCKYLSIEKIRRYLNGMQNTEKTFRSPLTGLPRWMYHSLPR